MVPDSPNPDLIADQKMSFSTPFFRPDLYPVRSPQSTFYTLSVFYSQSVFSSPRFIPSPYFIRSPQSVVRTPQSIFYTDRTKIPLQIPSGAGGPYIGGIQHCLLYHGVVKRFPLFQRKKSLNLTQHGNSLTELITEFVNMVIKRDFDCDT